MRQVAHIMGLPVSVDITHCDDESVFLAVFNRLRQIDNKFSTYKNESEVSKYREGKINNNQLSSELKEVLTACQDWEVKTDGYFSAWYDKKFDPSGYVKGWAIAEAGKIIEKSGYQTYCISAGGDIIARSNSNKVWNIGIQDPINKSKILNKLSISNGAVATSGNYERGEHIINPKSGKPAGRFLSLTVIGPDIITADVLATAAFAMGSSGIKFINGQKGYSVQPYPGK